MRALLHHLRWFAFALASGSMLALPIASYAQSSIFAPRVIYNPTGGSVVLPPLSKVSPAEFGRVWGPVFNGSTPSGAVRVTDAVKATVGKALDVSMSGSRDISARNVGRILARGTALGLAITAGSALWEAGQRIRCRQASGGGVECDFGTDTTSTIQQCYSTYSISNSIPTAEKQAMCGTQQQVTQQFANALGVYNPYTSVCVSGQPPVSGSYAPGTVKTPTTQEIDRTTGCGTRQLHGVLSVSNQTRQGCASGQTLGVDGKCSTGQYTPTTEETVAQRDEQFGDKSRAADKVTDAVNRGLDVTPYADPTSLTGPGVVPGPTLTETTTRPDGTTETKSTQSNYSITYQGDTFNYTTTNTTNNTDGSTTTTDGEPQEDLECGLPGKPACKIDETGTPSWTDKPSPTDQLSGLDDAKRAEVEAAVQAPTFGFIGAPPLVACSPIPLPYEMGAIDACPVVDGVRGIMAYMWAIAAAWLSLGWIREAVQGG